MTPPGFRAIATGLALCCVWLAGAADSPERNPVRSTPVGADSAAQQRFIVKFRSAQGAEGSQQPASALARRAGLQLRQHGNITQLLQLLQFDAALSGQSHEQLLARLKSDPQVEYAQIDRRRYAHALPNDVMFGGQWYLQSNQTAAIRADQAWDATIGSPAVVIAILDTGVRFNHPDLGRWGQGGRLLPGYDFVTNVAIANDGNGRDADPSDPGDWVTDNDTQQQPFTDCEVEDSSWHGTRVAGIIGARTNNQEGVAGITWESALLPVRVLGKCGGYDSDILPAMRWAGGLPVNGVPINPNPARIINMSLGSEGTCSPAYQEVIDDLAARGVLVVASAGNDAGAAVNEPANCPGVLGVAGVRHVGTKVGYSNIGPEVGISAPAGNCGSTSGACVYSLDTTYDLGTTTPQQSAYTTQLDPNLGTSFSAPIVAGVAALMRSVNSRLSAAQTVTRLQQSATPFPIDSGLESCQDPATATQDQLQCNCTTSTCGAGIVNAAAAVQASQRPFVIVSVTPSSASAGQTVQLTGSNSFAADSRTIVSYAWTVVSSDGEAPAISGANLADASFTASAAGTIVLRLTATDDQGAQDSAEVTVTTPAPSQTSTNPSSAGGGGGGGGGMVRWLDLLVLGLLASWMRLHGRRPRGLLQAVVPDDRYR